MSILFDWLKTVFTSPIVIVFAIAALGYLVGSVKVKGICLGTSGVLLVALVFGHFNLMPPEELKNLGLICFVTAIGFIAGPTFFRNFKKSAIFYLILGALIILTGGLICVISMKLGKVDMDLAVGMMAGAMTSTPGLAAAQEATEAICPGSRATIGYGIAYPFGIMGIVLFVQLIPKLLKVDIEKERALLDSKIKAPESTAGTEKAFRMPDNFGLFAFAIAAIFGFMIGKITIPLPGGASFSLGTSGGPLLAGLIMGHFAHIGPVSISVPKKTLDVVRELGLVLFLMGAGTQAGQGFVAVLAEQGGSLVLWSIAMNILPITVGFLLAVRIAKIDIFSALGSICGSMTSTPALGALISVAKTDAVALAYAATYPVGLIVKVLCCQFIPLLFG